MNNLIPESPQSPEASPVESSTQFLSRKHQEMLADPEGYWARWKRRATKVQNVLTGVIFGAFTSSAGIALEKLFTTPSTQPVIVHRPEALAAGALTAVGLVAGAAKGIHGRIKRVFLPPPGL